MLRDRQILREEKLSTSCHEATPRTGDLGNPLGGWHPEQKLIFDEALKGYTIEGSYAEFEEKIKGSIEPGKLADLTVISRDLTKMQPKEVLSVRVLETFVGGKSVYKARPKSDSSPHRQQIAATFTMPYAIQVQHRSQLKCFSRQLSFQIESPAARTPFSAKMLFSTALISDRITGGSDAIRRCLVRRFIHSALLVVTSLAAAQQIPSSNIDVKSKMDEGLTAFRDHDYKRALAIFNEVTTADPNNILAHNLAGNCSMETRDFPAAIRSFQRALQLRPDQPQNLAGLVRSYAQAGMIKERDSTLQHLHELSKLGRLPENFSYVFDAFAVGDRSVLVTEFPLLSGQFHFRYHFNVYDAAGKFVRRIALESDDSDQKYFAKDHPKEAAAGGRAFSLDGYSQTASGAFTHSLYKFYNDGEPPYEQVRSDVEGLLAERSKPANTKISPAQASPSQSPKP